MSSAEPGDTKAAAHPASDLGTLLLETAAPIIVLLLDVEGRATYIA